MEAQPGEAEFPRPADELLGDAVGMPRRFERTTGGRKDQPVTREADKPKKKPEETNPKKEEAPPPKKIEGAPTRKLDVIPLKKVLHPLPKKAEDAPPKKVEEDTSDKKPQSLPAPEKGRGWAGRAQA